MADDLHYVPGDFYRVDDRSGFKVRAKKQRKEWTGLIVEEKLWEIRHPQDFVKGVIDDQTVPEPRSRVAVDPAVGWVQTTLAANAGAGARSIIVASITGLNIGDTIEIMLNTNELFRTTIVSFGVAQDVLSPLGSFIYFQNVMFFPIPPVIVTSISPNTVNIANPLPYSASIGNIVEDLTNQNVVAPVTASDIV